jgi:hypothetical protein
VSAAYSEEEERFGDERSIEESKRVRANREDTEEAVALIFPTVDRLKRQLDNN